MSQPERGFEKLDLGINYTLDTFSNWGELPEMFSQLGDNRFLDVGAGQSDIAASLRKKGITAIAIDPAYQFPQEHGLKVENC